MLATLFDASAFATGLLLGLLLLCVVVWIIERFIR